MSKPLDPNGLGLVELEADAYDVPALVYVNNPGEVGALSAEHLYHVAEHWNGRLERTNKYELGRVFQSKASKRFYTLVETFEGHPERRYLLHTDKAGVVITHTELVDGFVIVERRRS